MTEQNPAKLLLDISEVCEILGLGRSHIYSFIHRGELRSLTFGRRRKVPVESVHEFVQRRQAEADAGLD